MKKIIWLLILIPIFMTQVWASEVYYSDYGYFSDYQEQKIQETDILDVEEITMYKWYKTIQIPGEFKLYNSKDNFINNCYETEYSNWTSTKPTITESMILEEKTIYDYQMIEQVRYIHFSNFEGSYSAFRIPELNIFFNDKEIDYSYTCEGCWTDFEKYIHNGIYKENNSFIDNGGSLIVDLGKFYPINQIYIDLYMFDIEYNDKKFTIGFSKDGINTFISKDFVETFQILYYADTEKFEYDLTSFNVSDNLWLYNESSEKYIDNEFVYSKTSYKQYRYKEKYCQTYTLGKEYYPQYSISSIGDYKLKESPKTFYRYRKRDKLELNIYDITEKYYDLNNFVIYNSDSYNIKNNINWDKNGTYQANFILNNINVTKDVKVNILSNAVEEKNEEIENLKNQLENTINDYEKIIENLQNTNNEYLNSLNDLNLQIIELNNKIQKIETVNTNQEKTIDELTNELNDKLKIYEEKIQSLEKINQQYLENLNVLSNHIYELEEKLEISQNNNSLEIQELNNKLDNYIKYYEEKISYLENFNNEYILKLNEINLNIEQINNNLNTLSKESEEKYNELSNKINKNTNLLNTIEQLVNNHLEEFKTLNSEILQIKQYLEELKINSDNIHDDLLDKIEVEIQNRIEEINNLNKEITKLEEEIKNIKNNNQIENEYIQKLQVKLNEFITLYEEKITELEKLNVNNTKDLQDITNQIDLLEKQINGVENNNETQINDLKLQLQKHIENYNNKISYLEEININYLEKLKTIDIIIQTII